MSSLHWKNRNNDARAYANVGPSDDMENVYVNATVIADPMPAPSMHSKTFKHHSRDKEKEKEAPSDSSFNCSYTTCAMTTILIFGAIIAIVLGTAGVFGTITYTHFVHGVADPQSQAAMLTPDRLNSAVSDVYATIHNVQVLTDFMKNFTQQLHEQMPTPEVLSQRKLMDATPHSSPFFSDGSYGAAMVGHLVGLTASLQNVSQHVQPESIGKIMSATGNMMSAINATELAPTLQGLLSHVSTVVQKTGEGIKPEDLQLLLHNTAEISVKGDLLPRVDRGMDTVTWLLQALHTPLPETPKK